MKSKRIIGLVLLLSAVMLGSGGHIVQVWAKEVTGEEISVDQEYEDNGAVTIDEVVQPEAAEEPIYGFYKEESQSLNRSRASSTGTYGKIRWTYDSNAGILQLSGSGALQGEDFPWIFVQESDESVMRYY